MKTKRKLLIAVLAVLCVSLLVFGTFAAGQHYVKESLSTGHITVALNGPKDQAITLLPGSTYDTGFQVQNTGFESYIRVKVEVPDDKNNIAQYIELVPMKENWDGNWDATKWTKKQEDGYYYYKVSLTKPAESATVASDPVYVKVSGEMGKEYAGVSAKVNVIVEAVQVKNNENANPWEADWSNLAEKVIVEEGA